MPMRVVKDTISLLELKEMARGKFGELVKAAIDVEKKIMVVGGEMHADEEGLLLNMGSKQENIWGINIYPTRIKNEMIEFDSIINIRPTQNNNSRYVENEAIRKKILKIVRKMIR